MLPAVELNNQMMLAAEEVDNEGTKGNLPDELETIQPPVSKVGPEAIFFFSVVLAQGAGEFRFPQPSLGNIMARRPLTLPSPRGERRSVMIEDPRNTLFILSAHHASALQITHRHVIPVDHGGAGFIAQYGRYV